MCILLILLIYSVKVTTVFVGSNTAGSMASGTVTIDKRKMTMQVSYVQRDDENFVIVALSSSDTSDYLDLLYKSIKFDGNEITFA